MRSTVVFALTLLLGAGCTGEVGSDSGGPGDESGEGTGDDEGDDGTATGTGGGSGSGGGPGTGGPVEEPSCDEVTPITIEPAQPPDMLLVVDKSGSMNDDLQTGGRKWPVMRGALSRLVADFEAGINFGLTLYPTGSECTLGNVLVSPAAGAAGVINAALLVTVPEGGTPTDTTLAGALDYYRRVPANPGGRFVLLATDGQPNCGGRNSDEETVDESVAAIADLLSEGITTYVLGFGDGVANDTLQRMATAGGTGSFFAANSPAELETALAAIADELVLPSCTLTLTEVPDDDQRLAVFFDDVAIPRSPGLEDGWEYDAGANAITLYGSACETLQSGAVDQVRVDYGCSGPVVE